MTYFAKTNNYAFRRCDGATFCTQFELVFSGYIKVLPRAIMFPLYSTINTKIET